MCPARQFTVAEEIDPPTADTAQIQAFYPFCFGQFRALSDLEARLGPQGQVLRESAS